MSDLDLQQVSNQVEYYLDLYNKTTLHLTKLARSRSMATEALVCISNAFVMRIKQNRWFFPVFSAPWLHIETIKSLTFSGIYFLFKDTIVLDKEFWDYIDDVLHGWDTKNDLYKDICDSLAKISTKDFVLVCDKSWGHSSLSLILEKYYKIDDIIDFLLPKLEKMYFALSRLLGNQQ